MLLLSGGSAGSKTGCVFRNLPFPTELVTLEAMAADLTVVVVNATGTRDIVQDGEDVLLTADDSRALGKGTLTKFSSLGNSSLTLSSRAWSTLVDQHKVLRSGVR